MKKCSLDLCLSPVTSTLHQFCRQDSMVNDHPSATRAMETNAFYCGRSREYDVVEIQIRAIIDMARKDHGVTTLELSPMRMESPLGSSCSVKRSVKRFLEKRNKRCKSVTPYTYTSTSSSSSHNF